MSITNHKHEPTNTLGREVEDSERQNKAHVLVSRLSKNII